MVLESKALKLIQIYFHICSVYEKDLQYSVERFSNNNNPELTDQEIMTIYLFATSEEQRFKVKHIYKFANSYLKSWFPKLGTYAAFNNRLNRLSEAFRLLISPLLSLFPTNDIDLEKSLIDSMPIMTCSGKRSGKVAKEITDKSFCSSKNVWYHGIKLHVSGFARHRKIPVPEYVILTPASYNDLTVFKTNCDNIHNRSFYGDKIYYDPEYFFELEKEKNTKMLTPVKGIKGQSDWEKKWNKAADDLYSRAVSSVRQPIESFFNWLIEKTDIQKASKVRSTKGLLVHIYGKLSAAFINLIFNP